MTKQLPFWLKSGLLFALLTIYMPAVIALFFFGYSTDKSHIFNLFIGSLLAPFHAWEFYFAVVFFCAFIVGAIIGITISKFFSINITRKKK